MFTRFFTRFKSLTTFAVAALAVAAPGASTAHAQDSKNLGEVTIETTLKNIAIRVSGATPELNNLANRAFAASGSFRRVDTKPEYDVKFAPGGAPTQVQVIVTRGSGAPVFSQVIPGNSPTHALHRAADAAVRAMTGKPGFFASRLAFIGERTGKPEVYVAGLFLDDVRQVTNDKTLALTPRWSPDGTRLLYTSYFRSGFPDIFQMDLGSLQRSTFVSFKGTNSGARYSPDGRNVAMVLSGEGNPEIYVGNAQGRQITRKTRTRAVEASPCFSPDGAQLVFTSDAAGGPQLYVMPAAGGSDPRRLPTRISGYCAEPDWSKTDPSKIVFTAKIGPSYRTAVYDLKAGIAKQVEVKLGGDLIEPSWLADGRHIVVTNRGAGASSLYVVDTETGKATRLSAPAAGKISQASVLDPR